ncbi:YDG domain-containing protein, partial [Sphingomonas floccifaciens]
ATVAVSGLTAQNKVYDGTTQATLTGGTITAFGSDVVTLTQGTAAFADKNAGTGKSVTVSGYALTGADAGNYTLTQPTSLTADITRAVLTVTGAAAQNKVYDGSVSATVTGGSVAALGSDTVTLDAANATGTFADKAAGTGKAVTATGYTLSGADAANYDLAQPNGLTADIARAMLAVTGAIAQDKVYDGGVSATLTGGSVA